MGSRKHSKHDKCMKAVTRFLGKVRDWYTDGMNKCSSHLNYLEPIAGCPVGHFSAMGAVASSSSPRDDDLKELVRYAELNRRQKQPPASVMRTKAPRSCNYGLGRIDEDEPCEFGDDEIIIKPQIYAR
ncbi:hypothetical protein RIF29_36949 [Crotalaria pallida]|uniref:Uncharacterized protein n=1 Tax=Crotalaria pallida TaxID=3830 RepID=A0AAN9EC22_CROPI